MAHKILPNVQRILTHVQRSTTYPLARVEPDSSLISLHPTRADVPSKCARITPREDEGDPLLRERFCQNFY